MAKKDSMLTPEERLARAERKKEKRKIFGETFLKAAALFLAVVFVYSVTYVAFGKGRTVYQGVQVAAPGNITVGGGNSTGGGSTGGDSSSASNDAAPASNEAEEAAKAINAATAAAVKAGYDWARKCDISGIDVGGQEKTDALNKIIKVADKNADVNSVVGGFIGRGDKKATIAKGEDAAEKIGYQGANYALKATTLKGADLKNFAQEGDKYTFTLDDVSNPQKDDSSGLARLTNDFITQTEVAQGIADALPSIVKSAITLKSADVLMKDIKVTVVVTDGKLVSLSYSYSMVVNKLELNLATGTGNGTVEASYTNFVY